MKKRLLCKLVSLLLCMVMLFSMTACGDTKKDTTAVDDQKEVVELECFFNFINALCSSENSAWVDNYLAENVGVVLRGRANDDPNIMSSLLASGDLPDLVGLNGVTDYQSALDGGLLLDLTQYKDKLPNIFKNEEYAGMIKYRSDVLSNGTGGLYAVPAQFGRVEALNTDALIRWDLYAELGYPQPANSDAFLEMLKDMQDLAAEKGEKTYAFTFFNDWDLEYMYGAALVYGIWKGSNCLVPYLEANMNQLDADPTNWNVDKMVPLLSEESLIYESLEILFKANQMGLVDPEATGQNFSGFMEKFDAGKILFAPYNWLGGAFTGANKDLENWKGYGNIKFPWMTNIIAADNPIGINNDVLLAISANCEKLDAALAFLNWMFSDEAIDVRLNGLEGWTWEYDKNGDRVLTQAFIDAINKGEEFEHPDGGVMGDMYDILPFWVKNQNTWDEETGEYYCLSTAHNASILDTSKLSQDWQSVYGKYQSLNEKRLQTGEFVGNYWKDPGISYFMPTASDEITQIINSIGSMVATNNWKMVFAADRSEFDALWEKTKADARELGLERVIEDGKARLKTAIANWSKYCK